MRIRQTAMATIIGGLLFGPSQCLAKFAGINGAHCMGSRHHYSQESKKEMITITGKLTDEGVECRAMRGDDGTLYTLVGDLKGFKTGDRVTVVGKVAEISTCMQGTTIQVKSIKKAE